MRNQVFNLWLLLLLLLHLWLYRRRTQSLSITGVSFQATQDIFSFYSCHVPFSSELPCHLPYQLPRKTIHESGVLRLPYGDASILKVSVLGNICGLQGPSQVWGSPSPYVQCWGTLRSLV